ncbi:GNAT family N-acetyltransferase [Pelosinus sp. sgz500959]|uniref:GNAT family N-acetyltransferase n=1 Tax=Pelosinus sp. sgz500959 TaxID=3242472 RepID=UPI00366BB0F1
MIRTLEEYSLNALPALQTMLYDGWVLRFGKGYTKRANCVNPIYSSIQDLSLKIQHCEQLYSEKNLETIFKITSASIPNSLDSLLEERGYQIASPASVLGLILNQSNQTIDENITYSSTITEEWLTFFCQFNHIAEHNKLVLQYMLENIIPHKYIVSLKLDSKTIGCGLGVLQDEYIGLYDIVIDDAYRNQGYGKKLIANILKLGAKAGAKQSYLQVLQKNTPAIKLYTSLGYKEIYQYWYRIKNT